MFSWLSVDRDRFFIIRLIAIRYSSNPVITRSTQLSQKKWIDDGLTNAICLISDCEVTVSVMGMNDMKSYLQDIGNDDTFILIKNLAVYHGYGVLIDINHSDHSCTFHVVHELYLRNKEGVNFGQTKFEYGTTTANLDESVFEELEE